MRWKTWAFHTLNFDQKANGSALLSWTFYIFRQNRSFYVCFMSVWILKKSEGLCLYAFGLFIYVNVAVCYLFFVSFCSTHFFFRNQTVWKQWCIISVSLKITCNLGCEMCTISEYMYTIIHVHTREKCIQCGPSMTF